MATTVDQHSEEHHGLDPAVAYSSSKLGMWLFLGTEVLLFGGLFAAYVLFRAKFPEMFFDQHLKLDLTLGTVNTVILIFSSFTMALAVWAAQQGNRKRIVLFMLITIVCGLIFGVNKYFEYSAKLADGIYPSTNLFFGLYYTMTGLHMLHVIVGIGILSVIAYLAHKGRYSKNYYGPVEIGGLYWHLVDLIWIYLFPLLYIIG